MSLDSTSTNIEYSITDNQSDFNMNIDHDGDQIFEKQIQPDSILNQTEAEDLTKPLLI